MKKIVTFSLASLLAGPALTYVQKINAADESTIILESPILHILDGNFIDADIIELIAKIRREINKILIGEKVADNTMIGRYVVNGKAYSVRELIPLEKNGSATLKHDLDVALLAAKKDLHGCVSPFIETLHSFKHQLLELIKESCRKRGMDTTLLLRWSEAGKGEETRIFNEDVTSFELYNKFCTDLLNFLNDLVNSCPQAKTQLTVRYDKCQKARIIIKEIIPTRNTNASEQKALEEKFMRYLKEHHIDKLSISEVTKEKLEALFTKFIHQKH
jgi:hypothetical protein